MNAKLTRFRILSLPGGKLFLGLFFLFSCVSSISAVAAANIAALSAVTASSETPSTGQLAIKAVDGVIDGYPGDYTKEWATNGQGAGAWIRLTWPTAYTVDQIVLYDRKNTTEQILSGTLTFSDGSSVAVGTLDNLGAPKTVAFTPRTITWVQFTINSVKAGSSNIGLMEMEVDGVLAGINTAPQITAGPTASPADIGENQTSQLSVTATDPENDVLTYTWVPQSGTITGSGATVTFNPPAVTADTVVRIDLTVRDPGGLTATGFVNVTVRDVVQSSVNIAALSAVTASSETPSTGQLAIKAVDGVIDGYPGDYTKEWATNGQGAGAWIRLTWPTAYTVDQIVLYDRKNTTEQILSGTLTFSDGSSVAVGALDNLGAPKTVAFTPRTITWVQFTINSVKAGSSNIGLMEMEVDGVLAGINTAPQITAGPTASPADIGENQTSQLSVTATDPENDVLTYTWVPQSGTITGSGATVTFNPPAVTADTVVRIDLTVRDPGGLTATGFVNVTVRDVPNTAPQITAGPTASPADIGENQTSQLSVTATDPENDVLTYTWVPQSGTITGSGATVTFNPPAVTADTVVRIDLTVRDPGGLTATGFVNVTVRDVPNTAPQITAGPTASPADIGENQTSQLSVTATDPENDVLTYTWVPQSGTITGSGATVTFNPPAVTADTVVRIDLTVRDPGGLTATGFVNVTVRDVVQSSVNIAALSAVTASSETPSTGQLAIKAVDGVIDGYPGDYTKEWATNGQGAGAWIRLTWPTAYTVDQIVLYDRKNTTEQILSGTLTFSDGSSVAVGALDNLGAPKTVAFTPRTITWVQFTINSVKAGSQNIGLMEMQVYGVASTQTILYRESFGGPVSGWTVIDNATSHAPSQWGITNGVYQESSGSRYSDSVGIFGQSTNGFEIGTYSRYDGYTHGDMDLRLWLRSNDVGVIGIMFGYQDDNNYYRFSMSKREGYRRLEKKVNGIFTPLVNSTQSYVKNQWIGLRLVFQNGRIIVFVNGEQVLAVADTSFSGGKLALWDGRNGPCLFDDIEVLTPPSQPQIGLSSPSEYFVSTAGTLDLAALVSNPGTVGGVEFALDEGTGGALLQQDLVPPYTSQFNILTAGTHQIRAYLLDGLGQRLAAPGTSDLLQSIGVNGYNIGTFGDSITSGVFDDLSADDISQDGRVTGGGYEPVLDDQLTSYYGKPVLIVTDGHPGDTSAQGWAKITTALSRSPASQAFLVMFGTNDAGSSLPPPSGLGLTSGPGYVGSYKEAMKGIIDAVTGSGKKIYLAKVPPLIGNSTKNAVIQTYNQVVDELVAENSGANLVFVGPDFYTYFSSNPGQIGADNIHPTGAGYAAMGGLWKDRLIAAPP